MGETMSTQKRGNPTEGERTVEPMRLNLRWTEGQGAQIEVSEAVFVALGLNVRRTLGALAELALAVRALPPPPADPVDPEVPPLLLKVHEVAALEREAQRQAPESASRRNLEERAARLRAEIEPELRRLEAEDLERSLLQRVQSVLTEELTELEVRRRQATTPAEQARLNTRYERKRAALLDLMAQNREQAGYALVGARLR